MGLCQVKDRYHVNEDIELRSQSACSGLLSSLYAYHATSRIYNIQDLPACDTEVTSWRAAQCSIQAHVTWRKVFFSRLRKWVCNC